MEITRSKTLTETANELLNVLSQAHAAIHEGLDVLIVRKHKSPEEIESAVMSVEDASVLIYNALALVDPEVADDVARDG